MNFELVSKELESIAETSFQQMKRWGLQPTDWEVYVEDATEELWVNVWFEQGPSLTERRKFGLYLLKSELKDRSRILPLYIHINFEEDIVEDGIAVWWEGIC